MSWWRRLIGWENKQEPSYYVLFKEDKRVYCGECKYFEKELNPYYYMDSRPEAETGVLFQMRQSTYKHNVSCHHPENVKVHVRQIHSFDEVREERFKNERSPRSINYENKCQWFEKKEDGIIFEVFESRDGHCPDKRKDRDGKGK